MKLRKRVALLCTAAAVALGMVIAPVSSPATEAHTGDLKAQVVCDTATGTYNVTYTLNLTQVGANLTGTTKWRVGTETFQGTPSSAAGMDRGPISSQGNTKLTLGTINIPGNSKTTPWVYAYTSWNDGFGKGSDGRQDVVAGDCVKPDAKDASASVAVTPASCTAPGAAWFSISNATWVEAVQTAPGSYVRTATANAGHVFSDGSKTLRVSYVIEKILNPNAPPCYVAPVIKEIPYPKLVGTEICGPDNDTVVVDPEWVKTYGHLVNGPWIDTKYKTQNGVRVVDGSAQIKPEFRKEYIWAGTAGTAQSDFKRWQMYPGTEPFRHIDTATVCPPVDVPANPQASIAPSCGVADITFTNPQKDGEANKTASFVVEVDGEFYGAYSVVANGSEKVALTFPEDSGDHKVEVFQAGTSEWKSIAQATVVTDCEPNVTAVPEAPVFKDSCGTTDDAVVLPEDTKEFYYAQAGVPADGTVVVNVFANEGYVLPEGAETEWVYTFTDEECATTPEPPTTPPATPEKPVVPVAPEKPVTAAKVVDTLATTGASVAGIWMALGLLVTGGAALILRRKTATN